jgi:hypothetical protein
MLATAWSNGLSANGIRIRTADRDLHFGHGLREVTIEAGGASATVALSASFWRSCPEIRGRFIADWLRSNRLNSWTKGSPPRCELHPLGGAHFRLERH